MYQKQRREMMDLKFVYIQIVDSQKIDDCCQKRVIRATDKIIRCRQFLSILTNLLYLLIMIARIAQKVLETIRRNNLKQQLEMFR